MTQRRTPLTWGAIAIRGFSLDARRYTATLDEVPLRLTPTEFLLLFTLLVHPGWVFTREQLAEILYPGERAVSTRAIDSHVKNLRRKCRAIRPDTSLLQTVRGIGYKCNGS